MYQSTIHRKKTIPLGAILLTTALLGIVLAGSYLFASHFMTIGSTETPPSSPAEINQNQPEPPQVVDAIQEEQPISESLEESPPSDTEQQAAETLTKEELPSSQQEQPQETPKPAELPTPSTVDVAITQDGIYWPQTQSDLPRFLYSIAVNGYSNSHVLINKQPFLWNQPVGKYRNVRFTLIEGDIFVEAFDQKFPLFF